MVVPGQFASSPVQRFPPKRAIKSVAVGIVAARLREADSGSARPAPGATFKCWTIVQAGEYVGSFDPSSGKFRASDGLSIAVIDCKHG